VLYWYFFSLYVSGNDFLVHANANSMIPFDLPEVKFMLFTAGDERYIRSE